MRNRLQVYFKEMLPIPKVLFIAGTLFLEIYFLVLLVDDVPVNSIHLGVRELIAGFTVLSFLVSLRIADDFKDYKTDLVLFPERPLPSGRVKHRDLWWVLISLNVPSVLLNVFLMPNVLYFLGLWGYGILMSFWFFAKAKIQPNLLLAVLTHNPVDLMMNVYIISFVCLKYQLPILNFNHVLIAFTLYWPVLIWEIARKTRAPEEETDYTTYSKLYGYKTVVWLILGVITCDMLTSAKLMWSLWAPGVIAVLAAWGWFVWSCGCFLKNPRRFKLSSRVERYELFTELPVILIQVFVFFLRYQKI